MTNISVAMSTYNGGRFLREQLDSLRRQRLLPFELQVGDDGSTDDTLDIIRDFQSSAPFPVHLHVNEQNLGFGENFVRTARRCSGEWVAYCDQDDVWLPEKLAYCRTEIERGGPDLRLLAHDAVIVDENLEGAELLYGYPATALYPSLTLPPEWSCLGFTQIFKRSLLEDIPASPRVSIPWQEFREAHDVWIALLANVTGTILLCNAPLVRYRRHANTVTVGKKIEDPVTRLFAALRAQSGNYRARAGHVAAIAELLEARSSVVATDLQEDFSAAAVAFGSYAGKLGARANIYEATSVRSRLASWRALQASGAYGAKARWPLGSRALVKDLAYAMLPSGLRR